MKFPVKNHISPKNIHTFLQGGINIKRKIHFSITFLLLITTIGIFVYYNTLPVTEIYPYTTITTSNEIKEVNEISKKIDETELTKKIIDGLIKNGYSPNKRILYTIYSPENKVLTISLSNFDKNDKTINKINNIINTISKENDLNSFTVELSETKK